MSLSRSLASKFAKITRSEKQTNKENTVYGTIKEQNGTKYVLLDGAEILTPVMTTVDFEDGERVTVLLKNHTATVTGNITSPASRYSSVESLAQRVKDNATLITNMKIYQGTTNPTNPIKGETLWIDLSVDPPLLKQYTLNGEWEVVGTNALKTSYIAIQNNQIDVKSGGAVNIKAGGVFTVEAKNLTINEDGAISASKASLNDATVNGTLLAGGYPVLHTGNIVVGSTEPSNPTIGMVWINPVSVIQTEQYILGSSGSMVLTGANKIGSLEGDPLEAPSGTNTYTIKVPISSWVTTGLYYVRVVVENANYEVVFPTQVYNSSGLIWYDQSITLDYWLGETTGLNVWVEISTSDDFSNPSVDSELFYYILDYPVTLSMICTPIDVSGWQNVDVKYFAG